jgi:predicted RNase H-like nuclease (RuvC/YqgF family)
VNKLSHSFDCKLFVPSSDISVEEKNGLTRAYAYRNFHQRDALAAALKALEYHRAKFDNVDARLEEKNLVDQSGAVKQLVLKGHTVEKALELLQQPEPEEIPPPEPEKEPPPSTPSDYQKKISELTQTAERLSAYKDELESTIETLQKTLQEVQLEIKHYDKKTRKEVFQSRMVKTRESIIKKLRRELEMEREKVRTLSEENEILKEMKVLEYSRKAIPVKVLKQFSREEIKTLDDRYGIKSDDVIYLKDSSGGGTSTAQDLIQRGVRAVITHEHMSHLAEEEFTKARIPVFSEKDIALKTLDNFGVVDKDLLESALSRWETNRQLHEAQVLEQQLEHLIEEYKEKRIRNESKTQ